MRLQSSFFLLAIALLLTVVAALKPIVHETRITTIIKPKRQSVGEKGVISPHFTPPKWASERLYRPSHVAVRTNNGPTPRQIIPPDRPSHGILMPTTRSFTTSTDKSATTFPSPPSPSPSAIDGKDTCWASVQCKNAFGHISYCYSRLGQLINPNDVDQSKLYQNCLCEIESREYKKAKELIDCERCLQQAGIDNNSATPDVSTGLSSFCQTGSPSIYLLLVDLLRFLDKAHKPPTLTEIHGPITGITRLSSLFVYPPGLNQGHTTNTALSRVSTILSRPPESIVTTLPTKLLSQLPLNWPYTKHGIVRSPSQTRAFTFTNPYISDHPVAILLHSLLWYPRSLNAKSSQDPLKSWTHSFLPSAAILGMKFDFLAPMTTSEPSWSGTDTGGPTLVATPEQSLLDPTTRVGKSEGKASSDVFCFLNGACMTKSVSLGI